MRERALAFFHNTMLEHPIPQTVTEHLRNHLYWTEVAIANNQRCPGCLRIAPDCTVRRRNTAYVEDGINWIYCCGECYQDDFEHFQELWDTIYG